MATHPVEAVATRDEVALDAARQPGVQQSELGRAATEPLNRHVLGSVEQFAAERIARIREIPGQLRLTVNRHARAVRTKINLVALTRRTDFDTLVHEPVAVHARADSRAP